MEFIRTRITLVGIRKPISNINEELQWFGSSLGLFSLRDRDKSCFRIFIELLKAAKEDRPFSSDELAQKLSLTRGTVVHHINKLIEAGIVAQYRNRYMLRVASLESLVDELRKDAEKTFSELKIIGKQIDNVLGL